MQNTEYHILLNGFNIKQFQNDGKSKESNLRHYRYPTTEYNIKQEGGAYLLNKGKETQAWFPVNSTTVLIEEIREREQREN